MIQKYRLKDPESEVSAYRLRCRGAVLDYEKMNNTCWLLVVAVAEKHRQKGIATRLLEKLFQEFRDGALVPGVYTELGEHLKPLMLKLGKKYNVRLVEN